jgi:subtilisin family serine protease
MSHFRLPPYTVEATLTALAETIDWGLAAYGVPAQWKATRGENIRVAVLDTGIDARHPDLADAIDRARDFTASWHGSSDRQGHGTHVAGTIAARANEVGVIGVAPLCRLLIAKVLGDDSSGTSGSVAAGVDWAVDSGADILSMSLGSPQPATEIHAAIRRAVAKGKFVICAAGNDGRDRSVGYPARWEETVAVGAVNRTGSVARFSSRGPEVDICAPGQDVLSTFPGGRYAKLSGTSMATPFVAGVVALMLAKHRARGGATPVNNHSQLVEHLKRTARDAGPAGHDPAYGYGLIDPASVVGQSDRPDEPGGSQSRLVIDGVRLDGIPGVLVFQPHDHAI